jgi:hypothetical protein
MISWKITGAIPIAKTLKILWHQGISISKFYIRKIEQINTFSYPSKLCIRDAHDHKPASKHIIM